MEFGGEWNLISQTVNQTDRQSALQTSWKEKKEKIPSTFTFYLHNQAVKNIIKKKTLKFLPNNVETRTFS